MNHPKREEWIPLLFGEANPETKQRLEEHLGSCAECAQEVNAWRRTVGRLDSWKVPKATRARSFSLQPVGIAAAAAIIIGAFMMGRFSAPQIDTQKLRAELKSELSGEIQQGFARAAGESSNALANLEIHLAAASIGNQKDMAREFVDYISAFRAEDRKATEALWEKLQTQYNTDFVMLRRDLETLASTTDDEISNAREKLLQLASNQNP